MNETIFNAYLFFNFLLVLWSLRKLDKKIDIIYDVLLKDILDFKERNPPSS